MKTYVYSMYWDVGEHVSFRWNISGSVEEAIHKGMYSMQIFMGNPKSAWNRAKISVEDITKVNTILKKYPMNIFTHYPYCANLAGKSCTNGLAWNGNVTIDNSMLGVIKALEYELQIMSNFIHKNIRSGVVIHPGSYPDRKLGHENISKTLNKINFPKNSILLLENCAGEGNKLCKTLQELQDVISGVEENKRSHVKICLDTAHLWGHGEYNLRMKEEVDRLFHDVDHILGMDKFYLLHLNDSEVPFGAKKDAHADIGKGYIWKDDFQSLVYLLNRCKEHRIPMVLETHGGYDMLTLSYIQPEF